MENNQIAWELMSFTSTAWGGDMGITSPLPTGESKGDFILFVSPYFSRTLKRILGKVFDSTTYNINSMESNSNGNGHLMD